MNSFTLSSVGDTLLATWERFVGAVTSFHSIKDVFDVLFVAVVVYVLLTQLRKSRSIQIIKGFAFVAVIYVVVNLFEMNASKFIFQAIVSNILVILVVVFSSEIRQSLERVGRGTKFSLKALFVGKKIDDDDSLRTIEEVCDACDDMSKSMTGSLIIFQRRTYLTDLTSGGDALDCSVSKDMLETIFYKGTPLHDGATVIVDNRIVAASCVIPLSKDIVVTDESVGTRHRAAISISQITDAVVVVTSEETGLISISVAGKLERGFDKVSLNARLQELLIDSTPENRGNSVRERFKNRHEKSARRHGDTDSQGSQNSQGELIQPENFKEDGKNE